jgi:hypothetical protein
VIVEVGVAFELVAAGVEYVVYVKKPDDGSPSMPAMSQMCINRSFVYQEFVPKVVDVRFADVTSSGWRAIE